MDRQDSPKHQLVQTRWGKLLFLSFHMCCLSLVLILSWHVDRWIEIDKNRWVAVEQYSKTYFAIATALPSIFLLVIIDLELFGMVPFQMKSKIFLLMFAFAVILFGASIQVSYNRTTLSYPPLECDGRVKCYHLTAVSVFGFLTSFCLLLSSIALGAELMKRSQFGMTRS